MRVTQSILSNTTLFNLNRNLSAMLAIQEKLSTGRDINKPTDAPVRFSQALTLRSAIDVGDQLKKNAEFAITWLNTTDKAISEGNEVLQRVRELAVRAASDTNSSDERNAIANEIDQMSGHLRAIANSDFEGRYLFNGADTSTKPYPDDASDPTDTTRMQLVIGKAVTIQYNTLGVDVFGRTKAIGSDPADPTNVFQLMSNLSAALRANDQAAIEDLIPVIDKRQQVFLTEQSVVGGKVQRLELLRQRLSDQNVELSRFKSETEDADMSKLITDLNRQDSVYRASLAAGSRVIQPTLIDYLR
ncbi:MAG: flagellar hook-associated protein FlgL [Candidatus Sericytochromatia bacterium]|nr:flagellar hook-associated protein FlgL [Candidatus Tanganyikabacteria bacterium]